MCPAQHITREVQRVFWEDVWHEVQKCNDQGDIAGVHLALKCALEPTPHVIMQLKDYNGHTLFERFDQLKC